MLRERYCQLLTAYVDGELSSRQRRLVLRLLHRSPEARELLQQLKADARALRRLPRPSLPTDLTESVLRAIAERNLTPGRCPAQVASATEWVETLVSWAAAAAVLFVFGAASYLYFAFARNQPARTEIVQKQPEPPAAYPQTEGSAPPLVLADRAQATTPEIPSPKIEKAAPDQPPKIARRRRQKPKPDPENVSPSTPPEETALTDRLEMFQLDRVPDLLPVVVKVSDLDRVAARKRFLEELHKDSTFRLELPCPNSAKAFGYVQSAAQTLHIRLVIDKQTQERLRLKWKTNYVLYIESMTPEELVQFMRQIGAEDGKRAANKSAEAQIDRLVLTRLTPKYHKELTTLLGFDPLTTSAATGPSNADPHQPPEHVALVLTYNPARSSPDSDEIKHFLESRRPARPGALRILLVLRSS
jgi:hypothetical protein